MPNYPQFTIILINSSLNSLISVINRNRRMPSVSSGSHQMLNSIQTKQVNKVKPNVNRPPNGAEGVVVSPSSYNR